MDLQPFGIWFQTLMQEIMTAVSLDVQVGLRLPLFLRKWMKSMIDESVQGKGYGSDALDRVIDFIRTKPFGDSDRVALTCHRDNATALKLYRDLIEPVPVESVD